METIRLNKYLSTAGVCSRREADRLIEEGKVTVDGETAQVGTKVDPLTQVICVRGEPVGPGHMERVVLAVYKPVGITCTTDHTDKTNIVDYVGYPERIYPIGRLDKDSEGLILMTNDGSLVNKIMRASNYHEKEYLVKVDRPVDSSFIKKMSGGVRITKKENGETVMDTVTRPCTVEKTGYNSFRIILTQGLNRQIRRMCRALGYEVQSLKRLRVMNVELKGMKPGTWRRLTDAELEELDASLFGSRG